MSDDRTVKKVFLGKRRRRNKNLKTKIKVARILRVIWSGELSRDGERRPKRDLRGLSIWRRHWLNCDAHPSHATPVLLFHSRLRVSASNASQHQVFYKLWYRKSYIMRKKVSPFTLKIHYKCIKPFICCWIKRDQLDVTCFFISLFNAQHVSDVLTSETCWPLNNEIKKQVTSIWSLFIQLSSTSASSCIRIPHHPSQTTT